MKKVFYLILIFIMVNFCFSAISLANGGLFPYGLYKDIYEPNQLAMIVFDDMVEKIIFQVDYEGEAENFAWVIPVPGYPELFSVEDEIFYELHKLTKIVSPSFFGCAGIPPPSLEDDGVHIWEENQVGIYHTTTLSATDPNSLLDWLNDNGYAFPTDGQEILDYYVQKQWFFVAMKIQGEGMTDNFGYYTGAIQPIGIMFFSDEMVYPLKISALSTPSWGTKVLIYAFSDDRVTFPGAKEEYNNIITPDELKEYPILQSLIDETFVLTKLRKTFNKNEMEDDLVLVSVPKYLVLGNIIDLNCPVGQFILAIGIFVFLLKIKNRVLKS